MSQIHKVTLLNKPLKIFEFTIPQLLIMFVAVVLAFILASNVPSSWKLPNGLSAGVVVWVAVLGAAIVFVKMNEVHPWAWWRNRILYRLHIVPNVYLPRLEEAPLYPDPSIIEPNKRSDDYYVESN